MTLRCTLHDEDRNETWYYESYDGRVWHEVEPEEEEGEEEDEGEDS